MVEFDDRLLTLAISLSTLKSDIDVLSFVSYVLSFISLLYLSLFRLTSLFLFLSFFLSYLVFYSFFLIFSLHFLFPSFFLLCIGSFFFSYCNLPVIISFNGLISSDSFASFIDLDLPILWLHCALSFGTLLIAAACLQYIITWVMTCLLFLLL